MFNMPAPKKEEILDQLLDRIEEAGLVAYTSRIAVKQAVFDDWDPKPEDLEMEEEEPDESPTGGRRRSNGKRNRDSTGGDDHTAPEGHWG
jgi:hypothetical protein